MSGASIAAFLFPGQGAHSPNMLDGLRQCPSFARRYALVVEQLGVDPLLQRHDLAVINSNKVSSMLTVLASSLSLDLLREQGASASYLAGYSVGQWTALYGAGCFDFAELIEIVYARASFMDECFADKSGAMVAVIGLPLQTVQNVCAKMQQEGLFLEVSNYNCTGQYSLAGDLEAVDKAILLLETMGGKKIQRLPVAGAWHCRILAAAEAKFLAFLQNRVMKSPTVPVCDNVSGDFLPQDPVQMKQRLAEQVASPVQWEKCIQTMCAAGCTELVEVGFGNVLTKFGFFINRKVVNRAFYTGSDGG